MTIQEIADTVIRGEKALVFPLKSDGLSGWVTDQLGHHVLDVRGWGYLQYADNNMGGELQDGIEEWIIRTLNDAYKKLS